ncbi:MAG TPA: 5'/3'-nucleotidase SurE [Clostridia bacterium]|nr:5'/3'-nucleotidase SurE [Clostridia bacterium]HOL60955.1 5'/3'-nucleotidase SurE [Clostridia bacterium]HPO53452.1 5'/3'-nucleotidase SurE [Clostridia bacterium]
MRILIVNDDGYQSQGIIRLAAALMKEHEITVVAPSHCYSGGSHAMTFHKPIYVKKAEGFPYPCLSVVGTPSDCVKFGLELFSGDKPDLIISGINNTPNIGTDVVYSGTVNAAIEGAMNGIPSIALSADTESDDDFDYAIEYFLKHFDYYLALVTPEVPISINYNSRKVGNKGHRITPLGIRKFADLYITGEEDERGKQYILVGEPMQIDNNPDCDVVWFHKGYATITPLAFELTAFGHIDRLRSIPLTERGE